MVDEFTITCAINAYELKSCEFESLSRRGAIFCDKVYQ
jgi:hypothetical protein